MEHPITIREAVTPDEVARFWEQLHAYHRRDIFPDPADEALDYFLDDTRYRAAVQRVHDRAQDRCYYLFFFREGREIGLALPALFLSEDGKCFLMEFCVYPAFRGGGTGTACAKALWDWARQNGAQYAELNCADARRRRFWGRAGFVENGADEWGEPLMLLPPTEDLPLRVEQLSDPADWQLKKLAQGLRRESGGAPLVEEDLQRLADAVREGRLTCFLARRGTRAVGLCSLARRFSVPACRETAQPDALYVEPAFRETGAADALTQAARRWCAAKEGAR